MPEIILNHVTKRFGKFVAVDDLSMVIDDRSFITLLGPSGCGKTTTLRMIAGLEEPTSGQIIIDGKVVFDSEKGINVSPAKRDVGFLFQNYALWPHMTVEKNIAFGLENLKWSKEAIAERIDELLKMLKIEQFRKRYPSELSGGQQQRVAIARTLAPRPTILFMDEPLSNLDAKLRLEMRTELKRLHRSTNSTFIYVTHDQLEAMTLASSVCLMKEGVVEQNDAPLQIYAHPASLFVADFVGNPTMNFIPTILESVGDELHINFGGYDLKFTQTLGEPITSAREVVLGIRPEYVKISKTTGIPALVYSSLPSGMETTVLLKCNDATITSVLFGIIDFPQDSEVFFNVEGNNVIVFDKETGKNIAEGSLEIGGKK